MKESSNIESKALLPPPTAGGPPLTSFSTKNGESSSPHLGRYRILHRLGGGGMGDVYLAQDPMLNNRLVAVKVPRFEGSLEYRDHLRRRFLQEASAAAQVPHHAHVCPVYDHGTHEGHPFLVMAYVPGGSLADRLKKQGRFADVREAALLAQLAAEGLHALHSAGVIHRDLKPGNVLLDSDGRPLLTDFGLARLAESAGLTQDQALLGTPAYMAPEQAEHGATAAREPADVYSLGATLYHMVTGQVPFPGEPVQVLRQLGTKEPPAPSTLRPGLDPTLEAVLHQMMARRPEDRPSAVAVAAQLGRWHETAAKGDALTSTVSEARQATQQTLPALLRKSSWFANSGRGVKLVGTLIALSLLSALVAILSQTSIFNKGTEPSTSTPPSSIFPPRIRDLNIKLLASVDGKPVQSLGIVGKDCYQAHRGDSVTLEAKLSEPAYAYIIAFRPDGTDEVCFPEKEDEAPPRTDRPRYPSESRHVDYGLEDGEGLQVFAVIISSHALPSYKEWKGTLRKLPWSRFEASASIVWRGDNEGVEALTAIPGDPRGKGHEVPGKAQVAGLISWLGQDSQVEGVLAVGFPVLAKRVP